MPFNEKKGNSKVKIGGLNKPNGLHEYYYFESAGHLGPQLIINMMDAQRLSMGENYRLHQEVLSSMRLSSNKKKQRLIGYLNVLLEKDTRRDDRLILPDMSDTKREYFRKKFQGKESYKYFEAFVRLVMLSNKKLGFEQFYPSTEKKYLSWGPPDEDNPQSTSMSEAIRNYQLSQKYWSRSRSEHRNYFVMHTGDILQLIKKFDDVIERKLQFSEQHVWSSRAGSSHPHPRFQRLDHRPGKVQRKKMCFQVLKPLDDSSRCGLLTGGTAKRVYASEMQRQNITAQDGESQVFITSIALRARDIIFKSHNGKLNRCFMKNGRTDLRCWVRRAEDAARCGYRHDGNSKDELQPGTSKHHSEVMGHMTSKSLEFGMLIMHAVTVVIAHDAVVGASLYEGDTLSPETPSIIRFLKIQAEVYRTFRHIINLKLDAGNEGITILTPEDVKYHLCDQALGNPEDICTNLLRDIISDGLVESLYTIYKKQIWVYLLEIVDEDIPDASNLNKFLKHSGIIPDILDDISEDKVWEKIKKNISLLKGCLGLDAHFNYNSQSISDYMCDLFSQEYQWCFYALEHGWDAKCPKLKQRYITILLNKLASKDENSKRVLQPLLLHALKQGAVKQYLHNIFRTTDLQGGSVEGSGFINYLYRIFFSSDVYHSHDIFDAKRAMSAFIWSMDPNHVIMLAERNYFGILCMQKPRLDYNPQLLYFYDYNPLLLLICLHHGNSISSLYPNFLKLCIDAWINKIGCNNRMDKKHSPYAISSINMILRSYDTFSYSSAEYIDITLKVLVFLSLEYKAFKATGDHDAILSYLKKFVADYFLKSGNIFNSGASASTVGGGSSIAASLQFHQAEATMPLQIWQCVTITGLTKSKSLQYNGKKGIIIGILEYEGIERCKVFTSAAVPLGVRPQHLKPLSGEYVIYDELLHSLLRLEHTIEEDRLDLQILSRDNIKSLVNTPGADLHAYFNFMQRLYAAENELYGINNLKVYNRLRMIPYSCTQKFRLCYQASYNKFSEITKSFLASKLGGNLLSLNIEDDLALSEYINRSLSTNGRGRCATTFNLLVRRRRLVSLENVSNITDARNAVGQSVSVGLSAQDSLEPLQDKQVRADENLIPCYDRRQAHGAALFAAPKGNGLNTKASCSGPPVDVNALD